MVMRREMWFVRDRKDSSASGRSERAPVAMKTEHTCCWVGVVLGVSLIAALVAVILVRGTTEEITVLRQVHVLMSHGERTPSEREVSMLGVAPERGTFAPYGAGALTNEGKMLTYEMGASLRKRYADFMGDYYYATDSTLTCSDKDISKTTALLIAAGMWPPPSPQQWNTTLIWQPIPYEYSNKSADFLLHEENCPRYAQEKRRLLKEFEKAGLLVPYKELFHKISQWTGINFTTPAHAFHLSNLFLIQEDIKVTNPKWAKHVKRKLSDVARLEYLMMFYNNLLRKLSGGALLHRIISEAHSVAADEANAKRIRMRIYTGTPANVAALLSAAAAPPPRLPDPGAALILELHEKVEEEEEKEEEKEEKKKKKKGEREPPEKRFGFKIFYWDDDSAEPRLMEIPGCTTFCSIEQFVDLTKFVVAKDYEKDCQEVSTSG